MSDSSSDQPAEVPFRDILGDVPLLREIQRVLLSSSGPVNWELARQVGIAVASWGTEDPEPSDDDGRGLAETVRAAELAIAELTGLPPPPDVAQVEAGRRTQWVESNVAGLREVIEPAAAKLGAALEEQTDRLGPEAQGQQMLQALMQRMVPLLMGAQAGMALGYLGQRVFGQYDVPVPRPPGPLLFVMANIGRFERDWSLPPVEFRAWVALHEVAHRFSFGGPWARDHFLGLVRDLVQHAEIDLSEIERGLEGLDLASPEALSGAFEGIGNLFGETSSPEQRLRIARVQAFVAAAEGYADHVVERVGREMLPSFRQISEAVLRQREGGPGDRALERLLGLETTAQHHELGRSFCDRVADLADEGTLSRMWRSADAMPSMPELEEPSLWLSRTA